MSRMGMNEVSIEVSLILDRTPVDYLIHIERRKTEPYFLKKERFKRIYPEDRSPQIGDHSVWYVTGHGYDSAENARGNGDPSRSELCVLARIPPCQLDSDHPNFEFTCRHDQAVLSQLSFARAYHGTDDTDKLRLQRETKDLEMLFTRMRFFDLVPDRIREPCFPGQTILGDHGENFPAVLHAVCSLPERKAALMEWIGELTPMDVMDFEFPQDPSGKIHVMIREKSGRTISAISTSDGTLRFLVLLVAMLNGKSPMTYVFEELENGIHPARIHMLVDLIERQSIRRNIQVITSTHSPQLLSIMSDSTFENSSVVTRLPNTSDAIIRRISDLPNVSELRRSQGLNRLHSTGWMEDVLAFTEQESIEDV